MMKKLQLQVQVQYLYKLKKRFSICLDAFLFYPPFCPTVFCAAFKLYYKTIFLQ